MGRGRNRRNRSRSRNHSPVTSRNTFPEKEVNTFPEKEENFRDISLYPEIEEIHSSKPKLCPITTKGAYRNVEHYLYVSFKVLREDFVNPLREAIKKYRSQSLTNVGSLNIDNVEVYKKVKFVSHNRLCFDVEDKIKEVDWSSTKRFMTGNLLIFSSNNFESFFLATVSRTDVKDLNRKVITVELVDKDQSKFVINKIYTMFESESFFTPYFHVLKALQEFNETNFPFKNYFVDVNFKKHQPPGYLNVYEVYNIKTETGKQVCFKVLSNSEWPTPNQLGLDVSQFKALKAALTNELAVIQGPPGTGKTFIGLKIVEVLLANKRVWNQNKTPILVVCFTNHALDQFLEALLSLTNNIMRVGKSDGGKLEPYNLREKRKRFLQNNRNQNEMAVDLNILRSAVVVGATTTLAAKHRTLFSCVAPKIVIVEEAAEVLEAHILASLTEKCQHLIMIGDHKQLRPNVNEMQSAKQTKLDVSLFERLIMNGMPHHMLNLQHRMRPEISEPLVRTIYPGLQNHPSVRNREGIKGVVPNVFFMTHSNQEGEADGKSKINNFEATMLLNLANYLLKQGYKPEEISILATYKAQSNYMEEHRENAGLPSEIRITTVDNFQGEENKIILLSLVRSNPQNDIGFLKIDNRVCVALSRARDGFFIFGNMSCLTARSRVWKVIKDTFMESHSYGQSLMLCCQKHNKITEITHPQDFTTVLHGGCILKCGERLRCGHTCQSRCHGPSKENQQHSSIRCVQPCARTLCSKGHRCNRLCFQPCDSCPCQTIAVGERPVVPPPVLNRAPPVRPPMYSPPVVPPTVPNRAPPVTVRERPPIYYSSPVVPPPLPSRAPPVRFEEPKRCWQCCTLL